VLARGQRWQVSLWCGHALQAGCQGSGDARVGFSGGHLPQQLRDDRRRPLVLARREVYFALRCVGWSYPSIAQLCERDHSSVLYAVREWIKFLNATNPNNPIGE
jgi:hypothetical protein